MKSICKSIIYIAAGLMVTCCAKIVNEGANEAEKRFFDSWIHVNHADLKATWKGEVKANGNGIYVIEDETTEGTGAVVTDNGYAIVEYVIRDLDGNITDYTDAGTARQLGTYAPSTYYGPEVWLTMDGTIQAGLQDAIVGMKVGGKKKVIIPSWLMTFSTYKSVDEYLKHSSDYSSSVYEFTVKDFTDSIDVWQADSIERYIAKLGELAEFKDRAGFYYKVRPQPENAEKFPSDTSIYINYTGRLLNGLVFDTSSERIAKDNNIYNSAKTYEPVKITWGEEVTDITMGDDASSVISGFAMTLWRMRYDPKDASWKDKGVGIFTSAYGYSYSGNGASIPGYAPLIFEIEIVDAPKK